MKKEYINFYNKLVKLTTNKDLYTNFLQQDSFSERLNLLLLHFAFFLKFMENNESLESLKVFKNSDNKRGLQELYDFFFRQLELNIREIGYGDQTVNKKMKEYINLFHKILKEIEKWELLTKDKKIIIFDNFFQITKKNDNLVLYFEKYFNDLSKNTLNNILKSVINNDYGSSKT